MTYLVLDKHGRQICECAALQDAVMMVGFDETRTVVTKKQAVEPTTVTTSATEVSTLELTGQKILDMSKETPFNP